MFRFSAASALMLALMATPVFAASTQTATHKRGAVRRVSHRIGHRIAHPLGQRAIAPERATQIQTALIHQNYLTGSPSGQWDSQTEAAMQKYQADHGWQTKLTPDSRALIAAYMLATGVKGLQLAGAEFWVTDLFNGVVLIVAVAFSRLEGRLTLWRRPVSSDDDEDVPLGEVA